MPIASLTPSAFSNLSDDNPYWLKDVPYDGTILFINTKKKAVLFSLTKRGDGWWSIFVSLVATEENGSILSGLKR
jgi:3'-phosphoadenosine 5'-phosphosulfate (PAPS) 3'-phosphatase